MRKMHETRGGHGTQSGLLAAVVAAPGVDDDTVRAIARGTGAVHAVFNAPQGPDHGV